ncbi:hypothetical protein L6164_031605 [Bauhinia variegata]|uniref:Uncharacterized protein n=1 Tax=Bauhinia variegata TaxID=167791 RepID=A0ACB9LFI7_BAUVA|nr:hypothetical protein L6164_031605 [Bauhinia variegata]
MENQTGQPRPPSSTNSNVVPSDKLSSNRKWWRNLNNFADALLKMDKGQWLEDMRGNLSMVATLIAAITFHAALNPTGGVVQTSTESGNTLYGCSDAYNVGQNETQAYTICTGEAVLAVVYSDDYLSFLKFNTFSFVASLSAALLLLSGIPLRNRFLMWFLSIAMSASLTFLAVTYLRAVLMVIPDPVWHDAKINFEKLMWIWIGLLLLICLFTTIRFLVWLVKICRKLFKLLKNKGNTSAMPENNVA